MSPQSLAAAKKRHQAAIESIHAGTVTISGRTVSGALHLGALEPVMKEDQSGWEKRQTLTVEIRKTLLPTAPAKDALLVHNSVSFLIISCGGQNAADIAWHITAIRRAT